MGTGTFALIAHRGDSSKAPDNTVHAFDKALEQGFSNFETDCQLTRDGVAIILHDETLGKTTNGTGAVVEHTWEQHQQLDAGSWFNARFAGARIPLLADVLQRYKDRAHIHLELKSQQQQLPASAASLIQQYGWDKLYSNAPQLPDSATPAAGADTQAEQTESQHARQLHQRVHSSFQVPGITITSFHLKQLQASKTLLPRIPHGWLIQEVTQDIIDTAKACGLEMICPRANALTQEAVKLLKREGFVVRAWGVKSIELLHHVVACGADGATVNWPAEAAEALALKV
eukprot:GHUV01023033.1.p1 GENE.GHUV01023033.1~~GHUV01023033.1.p1  ORF type:complete len:287 (+),score=73.28 GHUV01023033.1:40-900(+)